MSVIVQLERKVAVLERELSATTQQLQHVLKVLDLYRCDFDKAVASIKEEVLKTVQASGK